MYKYFNFDVDIIDSITLLKNDDENWNYTRRKNAT